MLVRLSYVRGLYMGTNSDVIDAIQHHLFELDNQQVERKASLMPCYAIAYYLPQSVYNEIVLREPKTKDQVLER